MNYFSVNCEDFDSGDDKMDKIKYYDNSSPRKEKGVCDKIFYIERVDNFECKIVYDRWLTTLILSCFILLLNIGLSIFGFLLFNGSGKTNL